MPTARLRYRVGTARLRTRRAAASARARLRLTPETAPTAPRPRRASRGARRLQLSHALLASDLNPQYVDLWPLVRQAWEEIVGIEAVLILVAEPDAVPAELRNDPAVLPFAPVPGIHTALQAQCIRLLYPALLDAAGVVISDIDMAPLSRAYFARPLEHVVREGFVAYRDVYLDNGEIMMCYAAAAPSTWGETFGVSEAGAVRTLLERWLAPVAYSGERGGPGWATDQRALHDALIARGRDQRDVWILTDVWTRFQRLERTYVDKWGEISPVALDGIRRGRYADFHCLPPNSRNSHLNEEVVRLAIDAARAH